MQHTGFSHETRATIKFSRSEIDTLLEVSASHYDGKCRSVGKPGKDSFLWGMKVMLHKRKGSVTEDLLFREIDLLRKICEQGSLFRDQKIVSTCAGLYIELGRVLTAIEQEWKRVNVETEVIRVARNIKSRRASKVKQRN